MVTYRFKKNGISYEKTLDKPDEQEFYQDLEQEQIENTQNKGYIAQKREEITRTLEQTKEQHKILIEEQKHYFEDDSDTWMQKQRAINNAIFIKKLLTTLAIIVVVMVIIVLLNL